MLRMRDMTNRKTWIAVLISSALLLGALGCQDEDAGSEPVADVAHEGLTVTPEFRIEGLDEIRQEVLIQDIYLSVAEVRLEPLNDMYPVYVTRTPLALHFDLASGQLQVEGPTLTLPHGGEYLIAIRIEPMIGMDAEEALGEKSMKIDGLMAKINRDATGQAAAGEPVPLPWRVTGDSETDDPKAAPITWVPWTYGSKQAAFVSLNDVHFTNEDDQKLVIAFDMSAWVDGAFEPITTVVKSTDFGDVSRPEMGLDVSRVDVSDSIDKNDENDGLNNLTRRSEAYVQ